jgi:hypothetical protein
VAAHASIASDGAVGILPAVVPSPRRRLSLRGLEAHATIAPMARLQATVALARYRLRTRDLADLLEKNRSTVTRWLNAGLKREREDGGFIRRLDTLDHAISSHEPDDAPMRYVAR